MRWCVRPLPEEDELLSSWLHRLAIANALCDHSICRMMFGSMPVWNRDMDRSFPATALPALGDWTGVSENRLAEMKLTRWTGRLSESVRTDGMTTWILPVGVYHRIRRRPGLQFCPSCLRERDARALWSWRMAWSVCCSRHQIPLRDRCPRCEAVYLPHRSAPSLFGRACCALCGWDLCRDDSEEPATEDEVQCQRALESALTSGEAHVGHLQVLALPFFEGLRLVVMALILRRATRHVQRRSESDGVPEAIALSRRRFEFLEIAERRQIMAVVWLLLQDWPSTFTRILSQCGVGAWMFRVSQQHQPPYWLSRALDVVARPPPRAITETELSAACAWVQSRGLKLTRTAVAQALGYGQNSRGPEKLGQQIGEYLRQPVRHRSTP